MSALRHVIWDFNGTLLDDVACCIDTLATLLAERSLPPITAERYRERFGFPVRDFYLGLGFDFEREDFEAVSRTFIDRYLARITGARAHAGAHDALRALTRRSLGQSVLSAMEHAMLGDLLIRYELIEPMQHVRGLSDLSASSKVDLGHALLAEIGLPAEAVVVVGDTLHDHETATALGCHSLLVANGHQSRARLERETRGKGPAVIVDALPDAVLWIERHAA